MLEVVNHNRKVVCPIHPLSLLCNSSNLVCFRLVAIESKSCQSSVAQKEATDRDQ